MICLLWAQEAWVSGAFSAYGISQYHTTFVQEEIARIWSTPPSLEYVKRKQATLDAYLAKTVARVDAWVADEVKSHQLRLSPVSFRLDSVGEKNNLEHPALELAAPLMVPLEPCRNLQMPSVKVTLSFQKIPSSKDLSKLESRLCQWLKKSSVQKSPPASLVTLKEEKKETPQGQFSSSGVLVRADLFETFNGEQEEFFKKWMQLVLNEISKANAELKIDFKDPSINTKKDNDNLFRESLITPVFNFDFLSRVHGQKLSDKLRVKIADRIFASERKAKLPLQRAWEDLVREAGKSAFSAQLIRAYKPFGITVEIRGETDDGTVAKTDPDPTFDIETPPHIEGYKLLVKEARTVGKWLKEHQYKSLIVVRQKKETDSEGWSSIKDQNFRGEGWIQIDETYLNMLESNTNEFLKFMATLPKKAKP